MKAYEYLGVEENIKMRKIEEGVCKKIKIDFEHGANSKKYIGSNRNGRNTSTEV
jgi:hypothetical protein